MTVAASEKRSKIGPPPRVRSQSRVGPVDAAIFLLRVATLLALCVGIHSTAAAHPISLTQATIRVSDESVAVELELFVEDIYFFHDLEPNAEDYLPAEDIRRGVQLHKDFLLERFRILNVEGERLEGSIRKIHWFDLPEQGVAMSELMEHKLTYHLSYPLESRPEFLTFSQQFTEDLLVGLPSEMRIRVYQSNADTPYQALLEPGQPKTIRFDWENPPLASDAPDRAWDAWFDQQRQELLGITSYSSVYSFLYIEDREIRHEILIPLLSLEASVELPREEDAFLSVAEQEELAPIIGRFFAEHNPVRVDDCEIPGEVRQVQFYGVDFRDFAGRPEPRKVSMASGRAGIIVAYPLGEPAARAQMQWDAFNAYVWDVKTTVFLGEDVRQVTLSHLTGKDTYYLERPRPQDPVTKLSPIRVQREHRSPPPLQQVFTIARPFAVAALILLIVGAFFLQRWRRKDQQRSNAWDVMLLFTTALLLGFGWIPFSWQREVPAETADKLFRQLHTNLYEAFHARSEERVYDALAQTVTGPLLRDTYLQIRNALVLQEQGGAVATIDNVQLVNTQVKHPNLHPSGFACEAEWTVQGTVEHWGHVHQRTHRYRARFQVEDIEQQWKITQLEVLDEQQIAQRTRVRRRAS